MSSRKVLNSAHRQCTQDEHLVRILDGLTEGYATLNLQWEFTFISPKYKKLLNLSDEFLGKNLWENFPLLQQSVFKTEALRAVEEQQAVVFEVLCPYTNLWIEHYIQPQADGVSIYYRSFPEKTQVEAMTNQAQRMDGLLTLASGMAHELNNILAPILLATRILRMHLRDEDSRQVIEVLQRNSERGAELIKQVLIYARGANGEKYPVLIESLISELVEVLSNTMPHSIHFDFQASTENSKVLGDVTQLSQVISNLCENAMEAMPEGGFISIKTRKSQLADYFFPLMSVHASGDFIVIEVSDTGNGIKPQIKDKIFDPFFSTKSSGQGTGLGLSSVHGIVRGHQGFISVKSEEGKGTTFEIYLPVMD